MIPDEAVEAAARAWSGLEGEAWEVARGALEAAAPHMLAEAWELGAQVAWSRSTPEVNGTAYKWRHDGEPLNPYEAAK